MRMAAEIAKGHAQPIAFGRTDRRPRYLAVEGPGREKESRRDLDVTIRRVNLVFAQHGAVGPRRLSIKLRAFVSREVVEIPGLEISGGIESVRGDPPDRAHDVRAMGWMMRDPVSATLAGQPRGAKDTARQ